MTKNYADLIVWKKAMTLVTEIYRMTMTLPKDELFGLTSQLRRAAVSIPSNIAEGQGRLSKGEFRVFLGNARGSLSELETQVLIARNLDFISEIEANRLLEMANEVGRTLNGLIASMKR
jgi:four helix bundle protein